MFELKKLPQNKLYTVGYTIVGIYIYILAYNVLRSSKRVILHLKCLARERVGVEIIYRYTAVELGSARCESPAGMFQCFMETLSPPLRFSTPCVLPLVGYALATRVVTDNCVVLLCLGQLLYSA